VIVFPLQRSGQCWWAVKTNEPWLACRVVDGSNYPTPAELTPSRSSSWLPWPPLSEPSLELWHLDNKLARFCFSKATSPPVSAGLCPARRVALQCLSNFTVGHPHLPAISTASTVSSVRRGPSCVSVTAARLSPSDPTTGLSLLGEKSCLEDLSTGAAIALRLPGSYNLYQHLFIPFLLRKTQEQIGVILLARISQIRLLNLGLNWRLATQH